MRSQTNSNNSIRAFDQIMQYDLDFLANVKEKEEIQLTSSGRIFSRITKNIFFWDTYRSSFQLVPQGISPSLGMIKRTYQYLSKSNEAANIEKLHKTIQEIIRFAKQNFNDAISDIQPNHWSQFIDENISKFQSFSAVEEGLRNLISTYEAMEESEEKTLHLDFLRQDLKEHHEYVKELLKNFLTQAVNSEELFRLLGHKTTVSDESFEKIHSFKSVSAFNEFISQFLNLSKELESESLAIELKNSDALNIEIQKDELDLLIKYLKPFIVHLQSIIDDILSVTNRSTTLPEIEKKLIRMIVEETQNNQAPYTERLEELLKPIESKQQILTPYKISELTSFAKSNKMSEEFIENLHQLNQQIVKAGDELIEIFNRDENKMVLQKASQKLKEIFTNASGVDLFVEMSAILLNLSNSRLSSLNRVNKLYGLNNKKKTYPTWQTLIFQGITSRFNMPLAEVIEKGVQLGLPQEALNNLLAISNMFKLISTMINKSKKS